MHLIVNQCIKSVMDQWIQSEQLSNGLLFYGSTSGFSSHAALYFITQFFSNRNQSLENNPNYLHVGGDGTIKIDVIRQIQSYVQFGAYDSDVLIVFIQDIDLITNEAANAFLKTLESPPNNVFFIFSTSLYLSLLPTIRSRWQGFYCPPVDYSMLVAARKNRSNPTVSEDLSYHDLLSLICSCQADTSYTFITFLALSLSDQLAYLHSFSTDKQSLKQLLYKWLSDIVTIKNESLLQYGNKLLYCLDTLTRNVNVKLQLDSLVCQLNISRK